MTCRNHPDRKAEYLCMSCGAWYCADCMAVLMPVPKCRACAGLPPLVRRPPAPSSLLSPAPSSPAKVRLLRALMGLGSLGLLSLAVWLASAGASWPVFLPFALSLLPQAFIHRVAGKAKALPVSITQAQVFALLATENKLSPSRLASATGATEEEALRFLTELSGKGELHVDADADTLIFRKPQYLE